MSKVTTYFSSDLTKTVMRGISITWHPSSYIVCTLLHFNLLPWNHRAN